MKKVHESTLTHKAAAFICGICILLILLITATQAVCYWIPGWWRNTLDDSMATIDGVTAPFFTEREKSHLADCRELFQGAIRVRIMAILLFAAFVIYIYMHNGKAGTMRLLASGYYKALGFTAIASVIIAIFCMIDFTHVFTVFHHIFFDNDLWILYPDKDNLINIMQEDVFSDAAMWIAGIWLAAAALAAAVYYILCRRTVSEED